MIFTSVFMVCGGVRSFAPSPAGRHRVLFQLQGADFLADESLMHRLAAAYDAQLFPRQFFSTGTDVLRLYLFFIAWTPSHVPAWWHRCDPTSDARLMSGRALKVLEDMRGSWQAQCWPPPSSGRGARMVAA